MTIDLLLRSFDSKIAIAHTDRPEAEGCDHDEALRKPSPNQLCLSPPSHDPC